MQMRRPFAFPFATRGAGGRAHPSWAEGRRSNMASIYAAGNGGGWGGAGERRRQAAVKEIRNQARRPAVGAGSEEGRPTRQAKPQRGSDLRFRRRGQRSTRRAMGTMSRSKDGRAHPHRRATGPQEARRPRRRRLPRLRRDPGGGGGRPGDDRAGHDLCLRAALDRGGPLLEAPVEAPAGGAGSGAAGARDPRPDRRSNERSRRPTDAELLALRDFWARRRRGFPMWT